MIRPLTFETDPGSGSEALTREMTLSNYRFAIVQQDLGNDETGTVIICDVGDTTRKY
jgi:mRNA-degrading endonuclease toxin of MazEF toxin-antitoxin module